MAELLIKARDAEHPDPAKDRRGCFKRGDVVCVMPDGHEWGAKEGLPRFVRVRVQNTAVEDVQALIEPQDDDDDGAPLPRQLLVGNEAIEVDARYRRRRWRLNLDGLPAARRTELATTGQTTITRAAVRAYLRRKRDNAQFGGL